MGHGDDELGKRLMVNFIKTAKEMDDLWQIVFMNGGVKLTLENSDAYNDLIALEKNGTRILSCGTCLSHFNLLDKKRAGETTNMLDIITSMQVADKVITV
jgi:selenium metabolism protein YedF